MKILVKKNKLTLGYTYPMNIHPHQYLQNHTNTNSRTDYELRMLFTTHETPMHRKLKFVRLNVLLPFFLFSIYEANFITVGYNWCNSGSFMLTSMQCYNSRPIMQTGMKCHIGYNWCNWGANCDEMPRRIGKLKNSKTDGKRNNYSWNIYSIHKGRASIGVDSPLRLAHILLFQIARHKKTFSHFS